MRSEEEIMAEQNRSTDVLTAYNKIPYGLINAEVEGQTQDLLSELLEICNFYRIYNKGADFTAEGTRGDYVPATLHYKLVSILIDKQARFLFAQPPTIEVHAKGDVGKVSQDAKDALTVLNDLVRTVLDKNKFNGALVKAARDCFIGKRVACLVNFNEEDGITISFLPSTQFLYETAIGNASVLTKFVAFIIVKDSMRLSDKRIFKKKYVIEDDGLAWIEEIMYDGAGRELEVVTEYQPTKLNKIPAVVILNDGLTGDLDGESEVGVLRDYEEWYSKLSNADIDAERKSMNPVTYTIDMDTRSTKDLSRSAGSHWDLGTDQNLEKPTPQVGQLEPGMNYSGALETTLDRMKSTAYEQIDMPMITLETMTGAITSGKALKAVYWPLIVRCREKMMTWGPAISDMVDIVIQGAMKYPNTAVDYTDDAIIPVAYEIEVDQNIPLPEDEQEEKQNDMAEVIGNVRSKKSYMKKWFSLTDDEVEEELQQMAKERQIIEDTALLGGAMGGDLPYPDVAAPGEGVAEMQEGE